MKPWPEGCVAVVCCRVGDPYWNAWNEKSLESACWHCGYAIIIGEGTLAKVRRYPWWEPLCVECTAEYARTTGRRWRVDALG